MTRINSNIDPRRLTDEHLLAEHREIKRLPHMLHKMHLKPVSSFRLGAGHVMFFMDKMHFTLQRYQSLHNECIRRGFNVTDYSSSWDGTEHGAPYMMSSTDLQLVMDRIKTRIMSSKKTHWHYCGQRITKEEAVNILYNNLNIN